MNFLAFLPEPVVLMLASVLGTVIGCSYFFASNKAVFILGKRVTGGSSWAERIGALVVYMVLALPVSSLLYEAVTAQQYAMASATFVAVVNGHSNLKPIGVGKA